MAGSAGGGKGEPEFQIAPMIDVLLVLLIFFMSITTAQVLKVDKTIVLPVAKDAVKRDNTRAETIVNVRWDEAKRRATYVMDDEVLDDPDKLTPRLTVAREIGEKKIAKGPNPIFRCVIRADRLATASSVTRVMNAAAQAGITEVAFSAVNRN